MTKGNTIKTSTGQTQNWETVSQGLNRVRQKARTDKGMRFTSLCHHITVELLEGSFYRLKKDAAPGLDKVMWKDYKEELSSRIVNLHERLQRGSYRATPVNKWRKERARGEVYIIRYVDGFVTCFQYEEDALRFKNELTQRMEKFGLSLHPEKTRLIEFGRFAEQNRREKGKGKPDTFDFLGFTHICSRNRNGGFLLRRKTIRKRLISKLREIRKLLKEHMHEDVKVIGKWLRTVIMGFANDHAVPTNMKAVRCFKDSVIRAWLKALRRRSQRGRNMTWDKFRKYVDRLIPNVRRVHPFPTERFGR